jgi:phospholipid/cholesterol/gamma-HCH transport system substrate-binding protein
MQKQAPTAGKLATMAAFALSCFGLLLFLWLSFGGPIPLQPQGYRFHVAFPEATQLALEADVRVAGVDVGKVRELELDPDGNRTLATIEMERAYAPVHKDAKAILRQKTLLGETYVELTTGTKGSATIPEDGRLENARVHDTVQLDEIFQALDDKTRKDFGVWQQEMAAAVKGRGPALNSALGTLPRFAADAKDVLAVLDTHERAVQRLVRNTGVVFGALTEREDQLRNVITGSADVFEATASRNDALAETFQVFPTFLDESRLTLSRLKEFAIDTRPLVRDLRPVMRDLRPTLRDTRRLAPDLRRFFANLGPLITVAQEGMPALNEVLRGVRPLLREIRPFLEQLNPILEWLEYNQHMTADFITNGSAALADVQETRSPGAQGHYLRQFAPMGAESAGLYSRRIQTNRGNAYPLPTYLAEPEGQRRMIFPNWDCKPSGGEVTAKDEPPERRPACFVTPNPPPFNGKPQKRLAHVEPHDYRRGR